MNIRRDNRRQNPLSAGAFTLVELMVAVALMTLIIVALYGMFDQTQRAFRNSLNQTDVLEGSRAALHLITRELEQAHASGLPAHTNLYVFLPPPAIPLVQSNTAGTRPLRTNYLEEIFFLSRITNQWVGIGYRVGSPDRGFGTLYRYSVVTNARGLARSQLAEDFLTTSITNLQPVVDGIVHLRFHAYDNAGRYISVTNGINYTNVPVRAAPIPQPGQRQYAFISNAMPAYVEIEMGIMEPRTLEQAKSMADPKLTRQFLQNRAGHLHLFQQRIPIRTAN